MIAIIVVVAAIHSSYDHTLHYVYCKQLSITALHVALRNIQTGQPNRLTHTNQLYFVCLPIPCMVPVLLHCYIAPGMHNNFSSTGLFVK